LLTAWRPHSAAACCSWKTIAGAGADDEEDEDDDENI
jgi:hypothetical protein